MRSRFLYNQRLASLLLAFALCLMAFPSGASWRCVNGTPCLMNCPTLRGVGGAGGHAAGSAPVSCSHCRGAALSAPAATFAGVFAIVCSSHCVLNVNTHPAMALSDKTTLTLPLLALPPPASAVSIFALATASLSSPEDIPFFPQRSLRPASGRAPPVCLA